MTLNSSGPISLAGATSGESIAVELSLGTTTQISLNDAAVRTLAGVSSGAIIIPTNFYGKSSVTPGLFKTTYAGYFADDVNYFTGTPTAYGSNPATSVQTTIINEPSSDDGSFFSVQWLGYFKPTTTETHTFFISSDDAGYMWIGATAVTGFSTGNATINNGGLHGPTEVSGTANLVAGTLYPIRLQFGENGGGDVFDFNYSTPTISKTTDVTGKVFYNPATNGF